MTTLSPTTISNRKPFVRDISFIDNEGPPPYLFFDETQDHLGAMQHCMSGWRWSCAREDFNAPAYPIDHLGEFEVTRNLGLTLAPVLAPDEGTYGAWQGTSGGAPYVFKMASAHCLLTGDFIFSARVWNKSRGRLDPVTGIDPGFYVGTGVRQGYVGFPFCPGFAGGDTTGNWYVVFDSSAIEGAGGATAVETDQPFLDETWYTLQITRCRGAIRWFINGRPIRVMGLEGIYMPDALKAQRAFETTRFKVGPANDGFKIDFFHRICER